MQKEENNEVNEKQKEALEVGLSEEVAAFVTSKDRNNKALNQEGMALGDRITIIGIADKIDEFTSDDGKLRKYVNVMTTGDRSTIAISRLVGTAKRAKYFDSERKGTTTITGGFDAAKVLTLPIREADALIEVKKNHVGKTYQVVAIAEGCGAYGQTFYLFAEV